MASSKFTDSTVDGQEGEQPPGTVVVVEVDGENESKADVDREEVARALFSPG